MNITSVKLIYFSPTGTTKKILESIAGGFKVNSIEHLDLTPPEEKIHRFSELNNEFTIIGVPVYGGRVPVEAIPRIQRLKPNNTPAVIVVVYGNRDYDDAILELYNITTKLGFKPIAAGAFIGEHQILRIAKGRPDTKDLKKARNFGKKIWDKLHNITDIEGIYPLVIPGNYPYIELPDAKDLLGVCPTTQEQLCTKCSTCVEVCPTAAISLDDTVITNIDTCVMCFACIKNCPTQARVMATPHLGKYVEFANNNFSDRKEPEIFL